MQYISLDTHDSDELACKAHAWDLKLKQMGCGKFQGALDSLRVGAIICTRWKSSHAMIGNGVLRKPAVVFTPVTERNCRSNWRGFQLTPPHVNLLGISDVMDHVTSAEYESYSLVVDHHLLFSHAAQQWDVDLEDLLRQRLAIRVDQSSHQLMEELPRKLLQLASAGVALDPLDVNEQAMEVLFQAFVANEPTIISPVDSSTRLRVITHVNDYISMHQNRPIYVSELCKAAECSERTLQYSILERYGVTPKAYLQRHRLNAVRHELKATPSNDHFKVRSIAKRWGFHHSGEFAASYRQLFGELPSATMNKQK